MEEVDNIVLLNLKEIGIDIDDVKSLGDLKAEHVYSAAVQCLLAMNPQKGENLPLTLPRGMSVKVNTTSDLATIIKAAGYRGELSYHQLLYPTAADSRKLLMWLFDNVPKKVIKGGSSDGPAVENIAIDDAVSRELTFLLQDSWTPSFAASSARAKQYYSDTYSISTCDLVYPSKGRKLKTTPGLENFYSKYLPFVTRQPPHRQEVAPSVFETNLSATSEQAERENEWNTKGLGSNLNPMAYNKKKFDNIARMMAGIVRNNLNNIENENGQKMSEALNNMLSQDSSKSNLSQMGRKIKYTTEDDKVDVNEMTKLTEEELQKKREEEILTLQTSLSKYQNAREELDKEIKSMQSQIRQIEVMIGEQNLETEKLERDYKLKKKTFDLLANPEKNMLQLQELNAQFTSKLVELAKEWEKHRVPLLDQIRSLRGQIANSKDETKEKLAKIKDIREQMKELATEAHSKDERYGELVEIYNKLPKDITRTHYTNRILDIVKNVKKQKVEISKILIDTRSSQKEINSISDTLNRTYSLVDELVFQEAKKDANSKEVYKTLVGLHDNFTKLTSRVEEIGQTRNAILNLEAKIDQVQERTNALNMEQVEQDLKEIKAENKALMEKIQKGQ